MEEFLGLRSLVVNNSANVFRKDVERLRMKLYSAKKFGAAKAAKLWLDGKLSEASFGHILKVGYHSSGKFEEKKT